MSWKVAEVIANLSTYVALAAGDLIFTGTPAGVSTVVRGDVLEAGVAGVGELTSGCADARLPPSASAHRFQLRRP
jgi:fumarylpyruvate hydrolase